MAWVALLGGVIFWVVKLVACDRSHRLNPPVRIYEKVEKTKERGTRVGRTRTEIRKGRSFGCLSFKIETRYQQIAGERGVMK